MHTTRLLTIPACTVGGVCPGVGCLPGGMDVHVTYPIMHLMLPVCCLHTNWDPSTGAPAYILLAGHETCKACWDTPPLRGQTDTCKNITFANEFAGGNYNVLVMLFCYRHNESCKEGGIEVKFSLVLQPCVDGSCTSNGECREYFSGVFHFSSCYCYAGKYW